MATCRAAFLGSQPARICRVRGSSGFSLSFNASGGRIDSQPAGLAPQRIDPTHAAVRSGQYSWRSPLRNTLRSYLAIGGNSWRWMLGCGPRILSVLVKGEVVE